MDIREGLLMQDVRYLELDVSSPLSLDRRCIRARPLLLAAVLILILAACAMVQPTQSATAAATDAPSPVMGSTLPTDDSGACAAAGSLATDYPEEALELIDKIRGPYAPQESQGRTNCTNERNFALQKLGEAQKASKAKPSPTTSSFAPVEAQRAWDKYVSSWQPLVLTAAGAILAMFVLARLLAFLPSPWMPPQALDWKHNSRILRRTAFWAGLILMVGSTLLFIIQLVLSQRPGGSPAPAALAGFLVLALTGSLLFGIWIASRPRLTIVVRDKEGKPNESLTSYIIALLSELGAETPRGIEVPRGADATGLADASVHAELSNKVLAALSKLIQGIVGASTWRVEVDLATDDNLSVVVTRNGWSEKATTISRSNPLLFPARSAEGPHPSLAAASPGVGVEPVELHKLAAAFVVATLAEHEQGFEGLCGATDWRSIGLQYLATTDQALDEANQKILLARAVELDPENLLASTALMNIIYRKSPTPESLQEYEDWLDGTIAGIEKLEPGNPGMSAAEGNPSKDMFEGRRALLYRLELTRLSVGMNRMAALEAQGFHTSTSVVSGKQQFMGQLDTGLRTSEYYLELAQKLVDRLSASGSRALEFEKRLRPHVAMIYNDLRESTGQGTVQTNGEKENWKTWHEEAMVSLSPTIAYSAACSYARSYHRGQTDEKKQQDWRNIRSRLNIAVLDAAVAEWVTDDPELKWCLGEDEKWMEFRRVYAERKRTATTNK